MGYGGEVRGKGKSLQTYKVMQDSKTAVKIAIPLVILGIIAFIVKSLAYVTPPGHATVVT